MNIKKVLLLTISVASAMAFALPATASAQGGEIVSTTGGAPTAANGTVIQITGTNMKFASEFGGFEKCILHGGIEVTNATASTGEIVNGKVTTSTATTCVGFGSFAGCSVNEATTTVNGHMTVTAHDIDLSVVIVGKNYGATCHFPNVDLTLTHVTATPAAGSNTALDDMTVSLGPGGTAVADLTDFGIVTNVSAVEGTLETTGTDIAKWRIATD